MRLKLKFKLNTIIPMSGKKYNKFKKITQISWDTYFFIICLNKKFQI